MDSINENVSESEQVKELSVEKLTIDESSIVTCDPDTSTSQEKTIPKKEKAPVKFSPGKAKSKLKPGIKRKSVKRKKTRFRYRTY